MAAVAAGSYCARGGAGVGAAARANALRALLPVRALHGCAAALGDAVLKVPSMGDSITEGTVLTIKVPVGDAVEADGVVLTLETDKVRTRARCNHVMTKCACDFSLARPRVPVPATRPHVLLACDIAACEACLWVSFVLMANIV